MTPSPAPQPADGELGPGEHWEYAIRHNQGIRPERSLQDAEYSLPSMMKRFESNYRNTTKPTIIRRRVSEWTDYEPEAAR